jgi:D-glucuronyl C5-epimerase C-terminus
MSLRLVRLARGVLLIALSVGIAVLVAHTSPASSRAARVVVLNRDGRAVIRELPFLGQAVTPGPSVTVAGRAARASPRRRVDRDVRIELARLWRGGAISAAAYRSYLADFNAALRTVKLLRGTRAVELEAVIGNLHSIAARGLLTASRLPVLFLTLHRNRQWWTTGPMLSTYQRVRFAGSQLVWEYYPGQGIELQELGSFSLADALCAAGPTHYGACVGLLSELIPLAAERAGRLTWEYYFAFDGGLPPWTSAMSQGTALQALADAWKALGNPWYLAIGNRALAAFTAPPPAGVAVRTNLGARYVQYTFDPVRGDEVINAFLQSLIGLDDYAQTSKDPLAAHLFAAGNAEAQAELPQFDTGAWSLYQPGLEDDLSYHELVTGFLQQLCAMTKVSIYCTTATHFQQYLKTPPELQLLTARLQAHRPSAVYFEVSKISRVGITVLHGAETLFLTSATFPYGRHVFKIPALPDAGTYTIQLDATDLAGNYNQTSRAVRVFR